MNSETESKNEKIPNKKPKKHKAEDLGNIYHRFQLMGLSLLFSGLGQMQVNQRAKGAIFLFAPLFATIATIFSHTPSFLYLAFTIGLMTGPLVLVAIYAIFLPYTLFTSPIFWLGIPIKLLTLIDAWFLGGKKANKPFKKKWLILFITISAASILIFHFKFSVISIGSNNSTTYAEPGDTIIVLGGHSITGGTLNTIQKAYKRGALVVVEEDNGTSIMRIVALGGEKVSLGASSNGVIYANVFNSRIPLRIFSTEYNESCVLLNNDDSYSYCHFRIESMGKNIKYKIAYPQDKGNKIGLLLERTITVPKGELFLLPDIRSNKLIGRILSGKGMRTVPMSKIVGIPLSIIWSNHHIEGIRWHRIGKSLESKFIE